MAEENLTLNKVLKKLSKVAGFKDLSPNQIMTKLASSKQSSVMNAVRAAKFTGGLATIAGGLLVEGIAKVVAKDQSSVPQKGPMRLAGRGKSRVDKDAVEAAVKEAVDSGSKLAPETSVRPKTRKPPLRPKTRPKDMMAGGMAKAKPRTGNMDYRMGGMFMKNGKK